MKLGFTIDAQSSKPVYQQLGKELQRMIRENGLLPGNPLPSVSELSKEANVSIRTMDRALCELIRSGICYRRPKKGTFVGNIPGAGSNKTRQVVILYVPSFGLDYFNNDRADRELYAGMRYEANIREIDLLMVHNDLEYYLKSFSARVCGVLLLESVRLDEIAHWAELHPTKRFVYANYYMPGFEMTGANVFGVFNDDFGGAFHISSYFFSQGYRKTRVLAYSLNNLNYVQRIQGYQFAADRYGVRLTPAQIEYLPRLPDVKDMLAPGAVAAERLLTEYPETDLILSTCDFISLGVQHFLDLHPEYSTCLVGYDGYLTQSALSNFPTMQINFQEIGKQALAVAVTRSPCPKQVKIFPNFINILPHGSKTSTYMPQKN